MKTQRRPERRPRGLFPLGATVMTRGVADAIDTIPTMAEDVVAMIRRHVTGDWGTLLCAEDRQANDDAIRDGDRIVSKYLPPRGGPAVYVITEADRSVTTVLLPAEY